MKLYDFAPAPNPRRVRMFLAEKGIEVPTVQVNAAEGEQFSDAYRKVTPRCIVPALELDDGTVLTESMAICRYFEELHPEPPLLGRDAKDKAVVEMWQRIAEIEGQGATRDVLRNSLPSFAGRGLAGAPDGVPQIPALVERGKASFERFLARLDERLAESKFLAGDDFTIADISAIIPVDVAKRLEMPVPDSFANVKRWIDDVSARPSAKA
ncbi:MAG: glutathione S-transferase family protein [Alphaproteobacteria bacterium]